MTQLMVSPDAIVPGKSGYTHASRIVRAWKDGKLSRMWALGPRVTSGQLAKKHGGGIWKSLDRMPELGEPMLDALESLGIEHPSTYSDCYHQLAPEPPRLKYTYNGMFDWWSGGPWEEAIESGDLPGQWWRYDMVSAYRWAAQQGLPDVQTFHACHSSQPENLDGLWVAYLEHRDDLPNTLKRYGQPVVISSEELRGYGISADIVRGVRWDSMLPPDYVDQTLVRLPCAKPASRAYWGRWISRDPLVNHTPTKTWSMPNRVANFIWGWLIVGRVRLRLWQASRHAAHVYVDEVLVPHELPTGSLPGQWHLKERYDNGIYVRRTGWYGALEDRRPTMQTGVAS